MQEPESELTDTARRRVGCGSCPPAEGGRRDRARPTDAHARADSATGPGPDTTADTARPGTARPTSSTAGLTAP
jgi:hypothetical protein